MQILGITNSLVYRVYANLAPTFGRPLKFNLAVQLGKYCVIVAQPDVGPWPDSSASLAHYYGPTGYQLASVAFNAQSLGIAISAITRAATCFFMSHYFQPFQRAGVGFESRSACERF